MSDTTFPVDPEDLAAHADRLRGLVRRLVADPGRVDDLVQETQLVALTHARRRDVPLRAWLVGIARNLVRHDRRTIARRTRREALVARPIGTPATGDLVERADFIRVLVEELVTLDEPYRETLLLRFVEGLEPREIAKRTGAPRGTVRSRLRRGLELIRDRLDARHGGHRERWLSLCVPLFPASRGTGSTAAGSGAAAAAGVIAMTTKTWAVAVGVLVLLGGAVWIARRDVSPDSTGRTATARGDGVHDAAPATKASRGPRAEPREEGAVAVAPLATPAVPSAVTPLRIRVRRADGLSAEGTHVVAWHDDVVECPGDAGAEGVVELPMSGIERKAVVAAPRHPLVWTTIPAGASEHEVVVPAGASVEGVVRIDGLAPRESVEVGLSLADGTPWTASDAMPPAAWARLGAGRGLWMSNVPAQTDSDGRFIFTGLAPGRRVDVVIPRGFVFRDPKAHPYLFVESDVPAQGVFLDLLALPRFSGRVVTSDGMPVKGAVVRLTGEHVTGGFSSNVTTDADGRFVVSALFLDVHSLALAISDADGKAQRRISIDEAPGPSRDLGDLRLADVRNVEVRVRDVEGRPISGAIAVESYKVVSDAPSDTDGRTTLRLWGDPPSARIGATGFVSAALDVPAGATGPIDVVLERAAVLEVKVNGAPSPSLDAFLLDLASAGALFDTPRGSSDEISSLTGGASVLAEGSPDGRSARVRLAARDRPSFVVSGLRAVSPFRLRLLDVVGTVHADREITLAAGERRVLVLDVPASRSFHGAVVDEEGRPVANAIVQPSQSGLAVEWVTINGPPVRTSRDGQFAFDQVRTDRLRVVVTAAGHPLWTRDSVDVPATGADLLVRLHVARRLRVALRDAAGAAIGDAVVRVGTETPGDDGAISSSRAAGHDANGVCQFDDCPLGPVVVVAQLADGTEWKFPVADGAEDVTLTVRGTK